MKSIFKFGVCVIAFSSLAACQTTTVGQGRIAGKKGAQDVNFQVTESFFGSGGAAATATLPDGEVFTGKLVTPKRQSTNVGETDGFGDGFDDFDDFDDGFDDFDDGPFFITTYSTTYSPIARGVLFSAKRSMRCQITLSSPRAGFSDGGVGQCQLSNGGAFPVEF
ncbi:hypothetical protein [Pseudovibrio sp. Tun.PSC04-5.I4]|uniref:hypothetical protein n=1 Tax=Pseudovibrio sp. Tun.PSC04-5.I4 TaxID=1798213 RepID=UPI00088BCAE7|nr:hypothetical protein [Pseudovibrio sp. Tun.PSC04-5.I4]SDR22131.1 hypothetical protein SAMN04515695_3517 [Pseudovibrio sp. Tun.PSC04-5.I4]